MLTFVFFSVLGCSKYVKYYTHQGTLSADKR
jgi:hypothetical protein